MYIYLHSIYIYIYIYIYICWHIFPGKFMFCTQNGTTLVMTPSIMISGTLYQIFIVLEYSQFSNERYFYNHARPLCIIDEKSTLFIHSGRRYQITNKFLSLLWQSIALASLHFFTSSCILSSKAEITYSHMMDYYL